MMEDVISGSVASQLVDVIAVALSIEVMINRINRLYEEVESVALHFSN
jgi:hypothetical protein